jgi:hypothetical protein
MKNTKRSPILDRQPPSTRGRPTALPNAQDRGRGASQAAVLRVDAIRPSVAAPSREATRTLASPPASVVAELPLAAGRRSESPPPLTAGPGFHGAVTAFKRRLIEATLTQLGGNRTRTARALGLQRTYLLRLMREFEIDVPAAPGHPRRVEDGALGLAPRQG